MHFLNGSATSRYGETYEYEVEWSDGPPVTYDSVVTRNGVWKGRPMGTLVNQSDSETNEAAVRAIIESCILELVAIDR